MCSVVQSCSNADITEFATSNGVTESEASGLGPMNADNLRGFCSENEACRRVFATMRFCWAEVRDCTM